jgi:hypothetical protein
VFIDAEDAGKNSAKNGRNKFHDQATKCSHLPQRWVFVGTSRFIMFNTIGQK